MNCVGSSESNECIFNIKLEEINYSLKGLEWNGERYIFVQT